jgi:mevalonate pyrophosphate decarboxylase
MVVANAVGTSAGSAHVIATSATGLTPEGSGEALSASAIAVICRVLIASEGMKTSQDDPDISKVGASGSVSARKALAKAAGITIVPNAKEALSKAERRDKSGFIRPSATRLEVAARRSPHNATS